MRAVAAVFVALLLTTACGASAAVRPPARPAAQDTLAGLSDEFDDPSSLQRWTELATVEGNTSWVRSVDIGRTVPGQLTVVPWMCGWYGDWRGVFFWKSVTGDFDVTTRLAVQGSATPIPVKSFSLAGLMARRPQPGGMTAWQPNHENWLFITAGFGDDRHPGVQQVETKTTRNSESRLELTPIASGPVDLRLVRRGDQLASYYRTDGQPWQLGAHYVRPDLPSTLQVGLSAYTDWAPVGAQDPRVFNTSPVLLPGDLTASADYIRFARPT